jgi:hypothetical protein
VILVGVHLLLLVVVVAVILLNAAIEVVLMAAGMRAISPLTPVEAVSEQRR